MEPFQEDLTPESTKNILDAFSKGQKPKPGPQSGRFTSENSAGLTALTSKVGSCITENQFDRLNHSLPSNSRMGRANIVHQSLVNDENHMCTEYAMVRIVNATVCPKLQ